MVSVLAPRVNTSLGALPGPAHVWEQALNLIADHKAERAKEAAVRYQNALRLIKIANNLGDSKSLITHPPTTTHFKIGAAARAELGIGDGMLRLSVGLENANDLIADVARGLAAARTA